MAYETKVEFVDTSAECIAMMTKLSKDALKQGGKVVTDILKDKVPVRTGYLRKSIKAWAKIDYKTGQPYLDVGYLTRSQMKKKYGIKFFVNPTWFEFGTRPHTITTEQLKRGNKATYQLHDHKTSYGYVVQNKGMTHKNFLRNTAYENIKEINSAMEDKLKELNDYQVEKGLIVDLGGDEEI